jgi:hypothetical protein
VPSGWHRLPAITPSQITNPRTVLVVGSQTVRPRAPTCQIDVASVQPTGTAVVVLEWNGETGGVAPGRAPLSKLTAVRPHVFECFSGRGAAAALQLDGHAYQVNVLVGDRASSSAIALALRVARSFKLKP